MGQLSRILVVGGVLVAGYVLALPFRHDPPPQSEPIPTTRSDEQLIYRKRDIPMSVPTSGRTPAESLYIHEMGHDEPPEQIRPLAPSKVEMIPLPLMSSDYAPLEPLPGSEDEDGSAAGAENQADRQPDSETEYAYHRIRDGDTLARLAERYLGDPSQAPRIYEANRGLLSHPDLLPLDVELKIPLSGNRP